MKRTAFRFIAGLVGLLFIPFIYNSCQGHLLGGSLGSAASLNSTCKVMMDHGVAQKVFFDLNAKPAGFTDAKVKLRGAGAREAKMRKLAVETPSKLTVHQGTSLGVILDNRCLQDAAQPLETTPISKASVSSGPMLPNLNRQVYLWTLDKDYDDDEIEGLADQEPCLLGVSWNQHYKMQSFNDPNYTTQDQLTFMHADSAYAQFYGGNAMATTGKPIVLATVDTGVDYTHPDLKANMYTFTVGNGIDITSLGTSNVSYDPQDISPIGHGTNVSGIMAAASNNGVGIVGTMPYRAKIMGVKIFYTDSSGDVTTTSQYLYNGIQFAYLNGANVINLSVGSVTSGANTDTLSQSGVTEAVANGAVVVVVIGNADTGSGGLVDGVNLSSIPGQYATIAGVIGVGSFDVSSGAKSYFSNYSTTYTEIGAPGADNSNSGQGIYSTIPVALGSYGRLMGTSQAAPSVSAAAGLTMGLIREAYGTLPSPAEVERLILLSAVKNSQLTQYFKDGNQLDLLSLVNTINQQYPNTSNGVHASLSANCN